MIHFSSDHHFGHEKIIEYCHRPFADVDEMDREMITRWNETVGPDDTVYYIGDFCMGDYERWLRYRDRLNGEILFVPSDHDRRWLDGVIGARGSVPSWILPSLCALRDKHTTIVLCHWMMRSWPRSHYNTWHVHGHHHRRVPHLEFPGKVLNVAVDLHDFYPWSLDEVAAYMAQQPNNLDFIGDRK